MIKIKEREWVFYIDPMKVSRMYRDTEDNELTIYFGSNDDDMLEISYETEKSCDTIISQILEVKGFKDVL